MFILLLYLYTYHSGIGFSAEFKTEADCRAAATEMISETGKRIRAARDFSAFVCVKKGVDHDPR